MRVQPGSVLLGAILASCATPGRSQEESADPDAQPQVPIVATLHSVRRIWDRAPHNAFTDLARWQDRFWCAFREGKGHAGDIGQVVVLVSEEGERWQEAGRFAMEGFDLRDADLSVTPDGRLMVLGGAQRMRDGVRETGTFAAFSPDGETWSEPRLVVEPGRWLWRVTWHGGKAYGVSYATPAGRPFSALHASDDGVTWTTLVPQLLGAGGWPTEAVLQVGPTGTWYCLHRRDGEDNSAFLGSAPAPDGEWQWTDLGRRLGGPNFLRLPSGHWVAAGRLYDGGARTELLHLDVEGGVATPILRLPSGGDTSYPGLVWHEDRLWMSYYSSHEGKTSIYLATIEVRPK